MSSVQPFLHWSSFGFAGEEKSSSRFLFSGNTKIQKWKNLFQNQLRAALMKYRSFDGKVGIFWMNILWWNVSKSILGEIFLVGMFERGQCCLSAWWFNEGAFWWLSLIISPIKTAALLQLQGNITKHNAVSVDIFDGPYLIFVLFLHGHNFVPYFSPHKSA